MSAPLGSSGTSPGYIDGRIMQGTARELFRYVVDKGVDGDEEALHAYVFTLAYFADPVGVLSDLITEHDVASSVEANEGDNCFVCWLGLLYITTKWTQRRILMSLNLTTGHYRGLSVPCVSFRFGFRTCGISLRVQRR